MQHFNGNQLVPVNLNPLNGHYSSQNMDAQTSMDEKLLKSLEQKTKFKVIPKDDGSFNIQTNINSDGEPDALRFELDHDTNELLANGERTGIKSGNVFVQSGKGDDYITIGDLGDNIKMSVDAGMGNDIISNFSNNREVER